MSASTHSVIPKRLSKLTRGSRITYIFLAALFTLGVGVQVFLAGLGVLVSPSYFAWHKRFAHVIEFLPLVMVLVGIVAQLSWHTTALTGLLVVLFVLQYVFLYLMPQLGLMPLRALHAVNALAMFWLTIYLGRTTWQQLRSARRDFHVQSQLRSRATNAKERVS
jgi:Family of unknown function (DUF6220)